MRPHLAEKLLGLTLSSPKQGWLFRKICAINCVGGYLGEIELK